MIKLGLLSLVLLLILRLGFFYFFPLRLSNNQRVQFETVLLEDPKTLGNTQQFSLRYGDLWRSVKLLISTSSDQQYIYGQSLSVSGNIKERLLRNKQIILTIQNPEIKAKNIGFLPLISSLRQKIVSFCENNFSQPYSGLLVGIIFGIKSLLTDGITRSFRITGLSHIVAASGMNVTLVAGFLIGLLSMFCKRQVAIVGSLVGIFFYVLISGFDPSILRAALMGGIAFSAALFGRQYSGLYVLCLVAGAILLCDPLLLVHVGFQLSVLATGGIVLLTPFGSLGHQAGQEPGFLRSIFLSDDLRTTFAAQIATLPIILATFGQYSLFSIVANILVLWTIPLIMVVGGIGIIVGLIFEPLGKIIVALVIPLLWYLEKVTAFFSIHSSTMQILSLPVALIVGYYLVLGGVILLVYKKNT